MWRIRRDICVFPSDSDKKWRSLMPRRNCPERPFPVDAERGRFEELWVDVRCKDGNVPVEKVWNHLVQEHCDRIGLFSGTASRAPDPQPLIAPLVSSDQLRDDLIFENLEAPFLAEKVRFAHSQVARQSFDLAPCECGRQEPLSVFLYILQPMLPSCQSEAVREVSPSFLREMQPMREQQTG